MCPRIAKVLFMRRGQVETITIVLIAGIIISLAGAAYFWGRPMMEKRSTLADVSNAKSFIVQLDKDIVETARSGGTRTLTIPMVSGSSFRINATGNEILYRFVATQAVLDVAEGATVSVPVETFDEAPIGLYGGSPRIITLEATRSNGEYVMTLRLKYRELRSDVPRGYEIVLQDGGSSTTASPSSVSMFFAGTETESRGSSDGGELTKTLIRVTLS
jgi:hypothetical protein